MLECNLYGGGQKDRESLNASAKAQVLKAIRTVSQNPLPKMKAAMASLLGINRELGSIP